MSITTSSASSITHSKGRARARPTSRTPSTRATRTRPSSSGRSRARTSSWPTGARRSCGNGSDRRTPVRDAPPDGRRRAGLQPLAGVVIVLPTRLDSPPSSPTATMTHTMMTRFGGCIVSGGKNAHLGEHTDKGRGGDPMHMWVAVLIISVLSVCPMMVEAGTTGEQSPEQRQIITKDNLNWCKSA
jgi:hypothetical protein